MRRSLQVVAVIALIGLALMVLRSRPYRRSSFPGAAHQIDIRLAEGEEFPFAQPVWTAGRLNSKCGRLLFAKGGLR